MSRASKPSAALLLAATSHPPCRGPSLAHPPEAAPSPYFSTKSGPLIRTARRARTAGNKAPLRVCIQNISVSPRSLLVSRHAQPLAASPARAPMGALQALIPMVIITGALGVGGNLLGWIPMLTRGEVCRLACPLPARGAAAAAVIIAAARTHTPKGSHVLSLSCLALSLSLQRKRHIRDEWAFSLWERDRAIKKEFN